MACLALAACESLEETYDEYAGKGEIRYMGVCTNVQVNPGWKRLLVTWETPVDPVVKEIRVRWSKDGITDSLTVARELTECNITTFNGKPELENGSYEVVVCSVDGQGNITEALPRVGRPYTEDHEEIATFTRVVSKQYYVGNRLVLFFTNWQSELEEASITYTNDQTGATEILELDSALVSQQYYVLEEPVRGLATLHRVGRLSGCQDLITFDDYELRNDKLYSADFLKMVRTKEGHMEIPAGWAERQTTVDYDVSCTSFEDILNLPNLETVYLGRNRYLTDEGAASEEGQCVVYDSLCSDFVLRVAHDLMGVEVVRYNEHYPSVICDFIKEQGNTNEKPALDYLDLSGKQFTCDPQDPAGFESGLGNLTDRDPETYWKPASTSQPAEYVLTLDLGSVQRVQGLEIVQRNYGTDWETTGFVPTIVKINLSNNNSTWEEATYMEETILGNSTGETCIVPFMDGNKEARYIRLTFNSTGFVSYSVTLADVNVY